MCLTINLQVSRCSIVYSVFLGVMIKSMILLQHQKTESSQETSTKTSQNLEKGDVEQR